VCLTTVSGVVTPERLVGGGKGGWIGAVKPKVFFRNGPIDKLTIEK